MASATRQIKALKKVQTVRSGELAVRLKRARAEVATKIRAVARDPKRGSPAFSRRFGGEIRSVYNVLAEGIDQWGMDIAEDVGKKWHSEALDDIRSGEDETAEVKSSLVKFDRSRVRRHFSLIAPANGEFLAATQTNNLAQADIQSLREITVDVFRQGQIQGWNTQRINKELQTRWDAAAGNLDDNRFVDRGGRAWTNARYFQMLTRTTTARVARESYQDTLVENGDDLAMVRNVGDTCIICRTFDRVMYSISGRSRKFPSYQTILDAGVFHPNCDCLPQRVDETIHEDELAQQNENSMAKTEWLTTNNGRTVADLENVRSFRRTSGLSSVGLDDPGEELGPTTQKTIKKATGKEPTSKEDEKRDKKEVASINRQIIDISNRIQSLVKQSRDALADVDLDDPEQRQKQFDKASSLMNEIKRLERKRTRLEGRRDRLED